jgi:hypothetical protein
MALARCEECGVQHERTKEPYSGKKYYPSSHPESGLICGSKGCEKQAIVRLTFEEEKMYEKGKRIFDLASATAKVRVK